MNPLSGVPKLCEVRCCRVKGRKGRDCCGGGGGGDGSINGDVCCGLHATALLAQANLDDSELAYAHFGNSIVENPYCIVVDHRWKSVVLSVRGTLSLEDCITDALTESVELKRWGRAGREERASSINRPNTLLLLASLVAASGRSGGSTAPASTPTLASSRARNGLGRTSRSTEHSASS